MERKGEMTKLLLGETFKEIMMKKSFDKITIKMITDAAGLIRPTFYNYFQDKYDVMEWMLEQDIFVGVKELIRMDMPSEAVKIVFRKMEADKSYYIRAFEVEGQNSFEEMLFQKTYSMMQTVLKMHSVNMHGFEKIMSEELFVKFHAYAMVNGIKLWLFDKDYNINADEALDIYRFLMSHSFAELLGERSGTAEKGNSTYESM